MVGAMENKEMQYQANKDVAKRSFTGSFIYLVIWLIIFIPSELYIAAPKECFWISVVLVLCAVARTVMIKNFDTIYSANPNAWKILFFPLIILTSAAWGFLCLISMFNPAFADVSFAIVISTAGLTGGGGVSLAPNKKLGNLLVSVLLVPTGIALSFFSADKDLIVGLIFFIYWFGMFSVISAQHNEYWEGLRNSFLLKENTAKLEELNTLDGLTGLKNRAYFDQSIRIELKKASRVQYAISLLIIDIDHFKSLNDRYGHLCGDECLKVFATLLSDIPQRETDVVARFGGEEFVIILPGITAEQSLLFAEKIRRATEEIKLAHPKGEVRFTASIGIANIVPNEETTVNMVIDVADKALYSAKKNGRNQVICGKFNF